jgi:glycine cleavage system H protein
MAYPANYRYTKEHEWLDATAGVATVGITDYAQANWATWFLLSYPRPGVKVTKGKSFGTVESVKAVSEIYAPASGEVVEANGELHNKPETINSDPHGAAWLVKIKLANPAELDGLMDAAAYEAYIAAKGKEASA